MKLVLTDNMKNLRDNYEYSVWLYHDALYNKDRIIYGIEGKVDFRLIFKLRSILGKLYIQSEYGDSWWSYLEHDRLYKQFVDKKK